MGLCTPPLLNMWPSNFSHRNCLRRKNMFAPSHSCRETRYFSTVHLFLNKSQVLHVVTTPLRDCLGMISLICFCFLHKFIPTIFFSASLSMSILFFPLSTLPSFLFASVNSKETYISFLQTELLYSSAVIRIVSLYLLWPEATMAKAMFMCLHSCKANYCKEIW